MIPFECEYAITEIKSKKKTTDKLLSREFFENSDSDEIVVFVVCAKYHMFLPQDLKVGPHFGPFVLAPYVIVQLTSTNLIYKIP